MPFGGMDARYAAARSASATSLEPAPEPGSRMASDGLSAMRSSATGFVGACVRS